jgi:putative colanic acid biosynthesis acetyltransferase WcaF
MQINMASYNNQHSLRSKIARAIWGMVWLSMFRPTPRIMLNGWRILLLRLFGAKIGPHCIVHPSCKIWQPWKLSLGVYVALSEQVNCYSVDMIEIGNSTTVSQGAFLCCASHDITSQSMELTHNSITIDAQAWVAARAFIGPGVHIGEGAVVGACAVVTKDVAPWTVVVGNPARAIKKRVIRVESD